MNGLLLVDKPSGITSHDVVARVRRVARMRRVGHAGTLDPLATGLLVLALGSATRTLEYLTAHDKGYDATLRLGQSTDSYDADGRVTATHEGPLPDRATVEAALNDFRGAIRQRPPIFSALKQGGEALHVKARRGESVEIPLRPVTVYDTHITTWEPPLVGLHVHCSKGTYIRSLAHDVGAALGVGAHLAALRRTHSGHFRVADAVPLAAIEQMDPPLLLAHLLRVGAGLESLPALSITAEAETALRQGKAIAGDPAPGLHRAIAPEGRLVAIVAWREGRGWQPEKVFAKENEGDE